MIWYFRSGWVDLIKSDRSMTRHSRSLRRSRSRTMFLYPSTVFIDNVFSTSRWHLLVVSCAYKMKPSGDLRYLLQTNPTDSCVEPPLDLLENSCQNTLESKTCRSTLSSETSFVSRVAGEKTRGCEVSLDAVAVRVEALRIWDRKHRGQVHIGVASDLSISLVGTRFSWEAEKSGGLPMPRFFPMPRIRSSQKKIYGSKTLHLNLLQQSQHILTDSFFRFVSCHFLQRNLYNEYLYITITSRTNTHSKASSSIQCHTYHL
jgi:hypothetical protein